jgi:pyrimidine oxygenase
MSAVPKEYGVFLPVANGGWIVSQATPPLDGGWTQNRDAAIAAEQAGFDFAMAMGKWRGFGGVTGHWGTSLEAVTMMAGIAALTSRIQVWATLHAILFNPVVAAKMIATLDHISGGRAGLNIVAGAFSGEFAQMGAWNDSLSHDDRYDLADEWTEILTRLWSQPRVDFHGRYFDITDCVCDPKPLKRPRLICAGMSPRGFDFSVRRTDGCFIGGRNEDETRDASRRAKDLAARLGKPIKTYAMMTVVWGATDEEAEAKAAAYRAGLDEGAVAGMLESYGVPKDGTGGNAMTARAQGAFMTQAVIGAPATCAARIEAFVRACDLDGLMFIFDEYPSGLAMAGAEILPRLKKAFA